MVSPFVVLQMLAEDLMSRDVEHAMAKAEDEATAHALTISLREYEHDVIQKSHGGW